MKNSEEFDFIDKLFHIFMICMDVCLCYQEYEKLKDKIQTENNILIRNALLDFCIVNWAKICGNTRDEVYIEKIFSDAKKLAFDVLSYENIYNEFLKNLCYSSDEYNEMVKVLKMWRDKIIVHLDYSKVVDERLKIEYFNKIPTQCKSIAFSIIFFLKKLYTKFPTFLLQDADTKRNRNLKELAEKMETSWHKMFVQCNYSAPPVNMKGRLVFEC